MEKLRQKAADCGACLEELPVRRMADSHEIRLEDWPARMRSATGGLIVVTHAPLAGRGGHPGEELIMEAYRRHVPLVLAGALNGCHKTNAVVPDYVDAGYRLGEHLFQVGCKRVVVVFGERSRETDAVLSGCRSAVARYGRDIRECSLSDVANQGGAHVGNGFPAGAGNRPEPRVGVVCVGAAALEAVREDSWFAAGWKDGRVGMACIADLGQSIAQDAEITSYEVAASQIARWALWLISAAPSGRRPVEMIIPGRLEIRRTIASATDGPLEAVEGGWPESAMPASERMAEVVI